MDRDDAALSSCDCNVWAMVVNESELTSSFARRDEWRWEYGVVGLTGEKAHSEVETGFSVTPAE